MKHITLKIGGMTCSACSNSLEKFLKKQPGIIDATVNLVLACADITYEDDLKIQDLNNYVKRSGFEPLGTFKLDDENKSFKSKYLFLIIYSILSVIFLYISMGHMFGLPVFSFIDMNLHPKNYAICLFILTIPYLIYGFNIFKAGIKNIFYLSPNMDTLVTIGVFASFIYSTINTILLLLNKANTIHNLYFESSAIVIFFVNLGRVIDTKAKNKTKEALKGLVQITPTMALLKTSEGFKEITIDEVHPGDILIARTGDKIAVDGIIINGNGYCDESFLTGESKPSKKTIESKVIAGSIVQNGYIEYKAVKIGRDSTISEIVRLVVNSTNNKAKISLIADKVSSYFVPGIIIIAIITLIVYLFMGKNANVTLSTFVSILVVACPCALGLATPLAMVISTGELAKRGILTKKSNTLEVVPKIDTVVFDKTGTLTYGKLKISNIIEYHQDYMPYVVSLEAKSSHPIANTFIDYAKAHQLTLLDVTNFEVLEGMGLKGTINNKIVYLGNNKILSLLNIPNIYNEDETNLKQKGNTIVYVIIDNIVHAIIGISDIIRNNAKNVIQQLQNKNINVIMLTGDNQETANIIALELGITNVISNVLPKEKLEVIQELIDTKHQVMMVGDGINDAPSLTLATIGVSINSGTDIALDAADVILMHDDLQSIIDLHYISKKTILNIKENLFWAFFYNVLMIPIAIGFFRGLGLSLSPMLAGIGMTISSFTVILNALRLKHIKIKGV